MVLLQHNDAPQGDDMTTHSSSSSHQRRTDDTTSRISTLSSLAGSPGFQWRRMVLLGAMLCTITPVYGEPLQIGKVFSSGDTSDDPPVDQLDYDEFVDDFSWFDWVSFTTFFCILMVFDNLYFLRRTSKKVMDLRECVMCIMFYIVMATAFATWIYFIKGMSETAQWTTGYFLEWMLSVDNLFVFRIVFEIYKCPDELQHKPLFYGILFAIFFRLLLFGTGEFLFHEVHYVYLVLGLFLIYSGFKVAMSGGDDDEDPTQNPLLLFIARTIPVSNCYDEEDRFLVRVMKSHIEEMRVENGNDKALPLAANIANGLSPTANGGHHNAGEGSSPSSHINNGPYYSAVAVGSDASVSPTAAAKKKIIRKFPDVSHLDDDQVETRATMSFMIVASLVVIDVLFAIDSASAIVAQVPDIFLAYTACVFAMMGLRYTYFLVNELVRLFSLLQYGVAFILLFTGAKLMLTNVVEITNEATCLVMLGTLVVCILGSIVMDWCGCCKNESTNEHELAAE